MAVIGPEVGEELFPGIDPLGKKIIVANVSFEVVGITEKRGTGGIGGYTECDDPIGGWQPGTYEVQIFMGYEWKVVGRFIVLGELATPTPTSTPTLTPTP